jgi:HK97 family phage prohead protease
MEKIVFKAVASETSGDLEYVMSDATVDRYGDIIDPAGWDLKNFRKNPIALFGHDSSFIVGRWKNVRVEAGKLLGKLELLEQGISSRLDEIRAAVEAGVLKTVSVGFRPVPGKTEPLPNGGVKFLAAELVECSLVSVPANPNALQVAKALHLSDNAIRTVFGEPAEGDQGMQRRSSGEPAVPPPSRKTTTMKTLSQRIEEAQTELVQLKDQLTEHVKADDADDNVTNELSTQIEQKEAALGALKRAESVLATKSAPAGNQPAAPAIRRPLSVAAKETKPADHIFRAAAVHAVAHATGKDVDAVLERMYGGDEGTAIVTKAAVAGATTTQAGWAAELVNTAMADFLETLRPVSVYPTLASVGGRLTFGPNAGAIKIPARAATPSIGGSFVGEGGAIPVRRLGLTSVTLSPKKMGVISVFSREIARYGTPAIEGLIRQEIIADTALTIDSLLLDANAASAVRPAGLLNGVTALTPTAGGGHAAILGDIRQLAAPFDTANAGRNLVLLMNPAQSRSLSMTPGPDGSLGWTDTIMNEFRVVSSTTVPVGRVILLDAADFVSATGDTPEFETSDQAVLHMEDSAPTQIGTVGTPNAVAAPVQSMFQTAQIAVRMLLDITWATRRAGMVQYLDGATW